MANNVIKFLLSGNAKIYYQVEKEFVAVGSLYTFLRSSMYYTAAHPQMGLWLCGLFLKNNKPLIIGFVRWDNISRVVIDKNNEKVFIVVKDYDEVVQNADFDFRILYKKTYLHQMCDTYEMSICLPLELFSDGIIQYLERTIKTEYKEEEPKTGLFLTYAFILVIALFFGIILFGVIFAVLTLLSR